MIKAILQRIFWGLMGISLFLVFIYKKEIGLSFQENDLKTNFKKIGDKMKSVYNNAVKG